MVRVAMRDDDAAEGIVRHLKPGDRGQEDIVVRVRVKRPPEIKHQALAATFELDAATTDLPRSAMDARTIRVRDQAASLPATEPCSLAAYARRLQPRRVHAVFVEPGVQDIVGLSEFGR